MSEGLHRKPQFDIYSTMLVIAFVAMVIGTVFAYLETADYKTEKTKGAPMVSLAAPGDVGGFVLCRHCDSADSLGKRHFA